MQLEFFIPVHLFQPHHVRDVKNRSRKYSSKTLESNREASDSPFWIFRSLRAYKLNTVMF